MSRVRRSGARTGRPGGFTLIEVLLATVLLVAGLALAFTTLGAANRTAIRGEAMADRSEHMRAVAGFLRSRLTATRPVAFGFDEGKGTPIRFVGEPDRLRFVADLPDYLGRGGPYLHDLTVEGDGGGEGGDARISLTLSMVLAGQTIEESPPRPPELLVEGLREARFRYRALDAEGRLGDWQDKWEISERLPLLVEVTLVDRDGQAWPPLVVSLPLAVQLDGAGLPVQQL
ncbi:prepilin-type N-terminal cleavage/methylation domain-containing protein [Lysobacter sp. S4-A87]|uniref:prepilin-type N-terminal cleavage/methylation domain-containing protein n=1 Tax=Lysobacter sp. S4-A87 TaxID=2925843 RepID=UPI001F53B736|nr:prepilin-type N-terminal cleavage/methylation domain-containing protein [Lysobacter sp. S4-A87]UNK48925.1 prepilin-type N-terminal cleavage/methylation domain-containing protein [Lysobacter sp. S4-A87]